MDNTLGEAIELIYNFGGRDLLPFFGNYLLDDLLGLPPYGKYIIFIDGITNTEENRIMLTKIYKNCGRDQRDIMRVRHNTTANSFYIIIDCNEENNIKTRIRSNNKEISKTADYEYHVQHYDIRNTNVELEDVVNAISDVHFQWDLLVKS